MATSETLCIAIGVSASPAHGSFGSPSRRIFRIFLVRLQYFEKHEKHGNSDEKGECKEKHAYNRVGLVDGIMLGMLHHPFLDVSRGSIRSNKMETD